MRRNCPCIGIFLLLPFMILAPSISEASEADRVRAVAEKMRTVFGGIQDYSSEVEQIYFKNGIEDYRYRFKYFFKKPDRIKVEFSYPYAGLIVFYRKGERKATLRPFPSLPSIQFRLSIDSSILKTPTGQQINQTDMIFFIDFLFRNLAGVQQKDSQFQEGKEEMNFLLWGKDYVEGEWPEKYRVFVSTKNWFPTRIERYSPEGQPVEISIIQNYGFNSRLDDGFFTP